MHAFGAWLANLAGRNGNKGQFARDALVGKINLYKVSLSLTLALALTYTRIPTPTPAPSLYKVSPQP